LFDQKTKTVNGHPSDFREGKQVPRQENEDRDAFAEREERILDAAAELIQRWGYKKTTIEDIARRAEVGKGTIYLHWKTREDLFIALLLRERLRALKDVETQLAGDPEGATLHGSVKYFILGVLNNPLLRAAIQQDNDTWSELMRTKFALTDTEQRVVYGRSGFEILRESGLVRADESVDDQVYMLAAISTGFMVLNQYLPEDRQLPAQEVIELLAKVVHRTFEARAPEAGEQDENLNTFHQMLDYTRELSRKKVE
jgi:AcrR family transcriptional regulator